MSANETVEINALEDVVFDVWDGDDWYKGRFPVDITADTTNAQMELIIWCEASDLNACGDIIDGADVHRVLTARRDALRAESSRDPLLVAPTP